MILLADSGSTKTDWVLLVNSEYSASFQTIGMNPYFIDAQGVMKVLEKSFPSAYSKNDVVSVFFYGSGCKAPAAKQIIEQGLQAFCNNAFVSVSSDLEAAAIALCGNNSGVVSILGTGMSIGYWNGTALEYTAPSLGYILGDEGSGAYIGKKFVAKVLNNEFSSAIIEAFMDEYQTDMSTILNHVYKKPFPNQYLASFVPFVYKCKNEIEISLFLQKIFRTYVQKYVRNICNDTSNNAISMIGSVAYWFQDIITQELLLNNLVAENIEASPIERLCVYHKNMIAL